MLEIKTNEIDEKTSLAEFNGEIDSYTSNELRECIEGLLKVGKIKAVVDMENLNYIDSTGLGLLVNWVKELRKNKEDLHLLNPIKRVENVIKLTNLNRPFKIFTNRDKAMKF